MSGNAIFLQKNNIRRSLICTDIREGTAVFDLKGKDVEHKEVSFEYQGTWLSV